MTTQRKQHRLYKTRGGRWGIIGETQRGKALAIQDKGGRGGRIGDNTRRKSRGYTEQEVTEGEGIAANTERTNILYVSSFLFVPMAVSLLLWPLKVRTRRTRTSL